MAAGKNSPAGATPRELVWQAMVDPEHVMHGPDGTDYPNSSIFREIVKPERIVYSHGGGGDGGPGVHFVATWTFEALGDKTRVTLRGIFDSAAERDLVVREYNAIEGDNRTLGRLEVYLAQMGA
jgi:uncharacterized protein YndB with AHSA1/START domain